MPKDNLKPTGRKGVFYLEHSTRKYGVRKHRQFVLRYTIGGVTYKQVFGWESKEITELTAEAKIQEFRNNAALGTGPVSLEAEKDLAEKANKAKEVERQKRAQEEARLNLTLDDYFNGTYLETTRISKKPRTVGSEEALYKKWVEPTMGHLRFWEIKTLHFKALEKKVLKGDRHVEKKTGRVYYTPKSPRTVHYCASLVIQAWNMAFDNGMVAIQPPKRKVLNLPMIDNERTRAFTSQQANEYFSAIKKRSPQWHDITMISLYCGLRASEIFKLEVKDFDRQRGMVFLKTPKKQKSQSLVLNDSAWEILERLTAEHVTGSGLLFKNSKGEIITEVSPTVQRVIDDLGFNDGVTDRRDKLTFHSWRHTFATWLRDMGGADVYTISNLLRHSTLAMTKKYLHPNQEIMRNVARALDGAIGVTQNADTVMVDFPERDKERTI